MSELKGNFKAVYDVVALRAPSQQGGEPVTYLRRGQRRRQRSCIWSCAENRPGGSRAGVPHTVFPELVALEYIQGLTRPEKCGT